ncbi:MAG: hypothetical protein HQK99_15205 [Nitrospirae bacterium]|nr:hypothetical protein [Nitrospirota bacterium]
MFTGTQDVYAGGSCSNIEAITTNAAALGNYTASQTPVGSSSNISVTYTAAVGGGVGFAIPASAANSIIAGSSEWSITSDTCAAGLGKNSSCTITVKYAPTSAASATGTLQVTFPNSNLGLYNSATGPFTTATGGTCSPYSALMTTVTLNPNTPATSAANVTYTLPYLTTAADKPIYCLITNQTHDNATIHFTVNANSSGSANSTYQNYNTISNYAIVYARQTRMLSFEGLNVNLDGLVMGSL